MSVAKVEAGPVVDCKDLVDCDGMNSAGIRCPFCNSKILPPKMAKFVEMDGEGTINSH